MLLLTILRILVTVGTGLGAIYGVLMIRRGQPAGKPLAVGCALAALALSVSSMVSSKPDPEKYIELAAHYNYISGAHLGEYLATKYAGQRLLILKYPELPGEKLSRPEQALLDGIQGPMKNRMAQVDIASPDFPESLQEKLETRYGGEDFSETEIAEMIGLELMDFESWFGAEQLRALMLSHRADYDVVVLTFDLPYEFYNAPVVEQDETPDLALINAHPYLLKDFLAKGYITAAVTYKPDPKSWVATARLSEDPREAFDRRFLLLTPDNVNAMATTYPELFSY